MVILFQREGNTYDDAVHLANDIASNETLWLNTLLEKKLGISPDFGGNPLKDAAVMCVSFGASAIIPINPVPVSGRRPGRHWSVRWIYR